jgi:hypothetical protein
MPVDQYGRVIVNPSVPLGMADFAQLYTANGNSPQENSSQMFFDAPSEGRSYIDAQWSKMNRGTSPEQYFADPANVAAALATVHPNAASARREPAAAASLSPSVGEQWPTFQNEDERNIAINTGAYDPSYTTPTKRLAAVTERLRGHPYAEVMADPDLRAIMGSDPKRGKYVYGAITGGRDFEHDMSQSELNARQDKQDAEREQLRKESEQRYYEHQLSQEERQARAQAVNEQRATELRRIRQEEEDAHKAAMAHTEFDSKRFDQLAEANAHYDPSTGKLMTWQNQEADPTSVDSRPVRKLMEATPEDERVWRETYQSKLGVEPPLKPMPEAAAAAFMSNTGVNIPGNLIPGAIRGAQDFAVATAPPSIQTHIQTQLQKAMALKGGPLSPLEKQMVISKAAKEATPLFSVGETPSRFNTVANKTFGNMMGFNDWVPGQGGTTPNALGRFGRGLIDSYIRMGSDEAAARGAAGW